MSVGLIRRIQRLTARRIIWSRPHRRSVLLIDPSGIDILTQFIAIEDIEILDFEETNIWIFIRTILRMKFSTSAYVVTYIQMMQPKVVMTFIDNDVNFYKLKSMCTQTKFVAIQNGVRANYSSSPTSGFFDKLSLATKDKKLSADYFCAFGGAAAAQISQFVQCEQILIGSLKNNLFDSHKNSQTASYDVVLISQYPPFSVQDELRQIYFGSHAISLADFYKVEALAANMIAKYCFQQKLSFAVCGKRESSSSNEYDFFNQAVDSLPWTYRSRTSANSTYELSSAAKIIVSIDSTVGQEFLARGNRVAVIAARTQVADSVGLSHRKDTAFGYPLDFPPTGKFWTDVASEPELVRILDYLRVVTDEEWAAELAPYNESLMAYQPGNPVFKKLLLDLGLTLIDGVKSDA